jgi:hypothetical protein
MNKPIYFKQHRIDITCLRWVTYYGLITYGRDAMYLDIVPK